MDKFWKKLILLSMLSVLSHSSYAGPPFITDDPEPVDYRDWEINYAISKTWRSDGASAGMPSVDINYGLTKDLQLHAQPKYGYESDSQGKNIGLDNTEIGMKYRFINAQHGDARWMLGTYPMIQLPTGEKRLGESRGKFQAFLPLWAQYDFQNWTAYGGFGYRLNNYPDSRNSWFSGATVLYRVTDRTQLGGEIYHETATNAGDRGITGFNVGGIYNIVEDYRLLFSLGRGTSNVSTTNQFSSYLALQVIY